jgi:hypothetical protein
MSMELRLFSDRRLDSISEWQRAIDAEDFPLRLSDETPLDKVNGFLPSYLHDKLTGFECNHWNANEIMAENPDIDFGHDWKHVLAFRWLGSKQDEAIAAWMAATAYARVTDGVVFDDQEGKLRTAPQALEVVRDLESDDQHIIDQVREALRQRRLKP